MENVSETATEDSTVTPFSMNLVPWQLLTRSQKIIALMASSSLLTGNQVSYSQPKNAVKLQYDRDVVKLKIKEAKARLMQECPCRGI